MTTFSKLLESYVSGPLGIEALALIRDDGEVVATAGSNEESLRMAASFLIGLQQLGDRLAEETGRGQTTQILIAGRSGHLAMTRVGDRHTLLACTSETSALGVVAHDLQWWARELQPFVGGR
jgi:predicted regulator of Ras-like GTPase activity (Roadblock/LC7/MglB family)